MKKLFAMLALMGAMTFAPVSVMAQDAPAEAAVVEEVVADSAACDSTAACCDSTKAE